MDLLVEENKWSSNQDKNINAKFYIDDIDKNEIILEFIHSKLNKTETERVKFKKDYLSGVLLLTSDQRTDTAKLYQKSNELYLEANNQIKIFVKI